MTIASAKQSELNCSLVTPSFRLTGKRALVTGGSKGIGFAAALALAQAGASVTIIARDPIALETALQQLNAYQHVNYSPASYSQANDSQANCSRVISQQTFAAVAIDVTNHAQVSAWVNSEVPFDILVNSAGIARHGVFVDVALADYQAVMNINLAATLFISQAVAKKMIEVKSGGSIIHISSQMGHVSGPKRALYSASKFAVEGLSKGMALELGEYNIRVNTLCPTFIETELTTKMLADETFHQWVLNKIALRRLGQLDDIMGPVVFLASDASKLITGTSLLVDGGWTAE